MDAEQIPLFTRATTKRNHKIIVLAKTQATLHFTYQIGFRDNEVALSATDLIVGILENSNVDDECIKDCTPCSYQVESYHEGLYRGSKALVTGVIRHIVEKIHPDTLLTGSFDSALAIYRADEIASVEPAATFNFLTHPSKLVRIIGGYLYSEGEIERLKNDKGMQKAEETVTQDFYDTFTYLGQKRIEKIYHLCYKEGMTVAEQLEQMQTAISLLIE